MIKILIIKLGALGDVLRTTPILHAIKEKYPDQKEQIRKTLEDGRFKISQYHDDIFPPEEPKP